ncbi:MAG TPA: DUF5668 domain-containing protein [Hanamia sp.]|nr:DUF5668 domain-containing protein [Hanamia sp.]
MEQNDVNEYRKIGSSRIWSGLILLAAGLLLLAYKMGAPIPGWLFTWPVLLILIGFISGFKSKFHNPGAFIMILIGGIFLIDQSMPGIDFHNYIIPIILIAIGLVFILRPKRGCNFRQSRRWNNINQTGETSANFLDENKISGANENAEYVNINAVFSGVKKKILSKNFKGGEITSFMGGTEINFLQADIQHPVVLEVNNIFGGTKIVLPSNWDIKNEVTALFGGIEDKRIINNIMPDANKTVLLKGACVFGGIEVSNY